MKRILILIGFLISFELSYGQIYVSGLITTDSTWSASDSLIIIEGNLKITSTGSLKIEPGIIIKINSGVVIQVDGELIARGNENNRIVFYPNTLTPNKGYWQHIFFTNSSKDAVFSSGSYTSGCILEYCDLAYGGGTSNGIIYIEQSSPFINKCKIISSSSCGIKIKQGGSILLKNTLIDKNTGDGILFPNSQINDVLIDNCTISNNAGKGINFPIAISPGKASIINNIINNNNGGIFLYCDGGSGSGSVDIIGNKIYNNTSTIGGGIYIARGYNMKVSKNIIKSNSATNGGGLYFGEGWNPFIYYVTENIFIENTATNGAAIYSNFNVTGGYKTDTYIDNNNFLSNKSNNSIVLLSGYINQNNPIDYNPIKYYVQNNTFNGDSAAKLIVLDKYLGYFSKNNLLENQITYIIENQNIAGKPDIDFINNYWGKITSKEVNKYIYDWLDNGSLSSVLFNPTFVKHDSIAPISTPFNLSKRETENGIELIWNKNKEADVKGYKIYYSPKDIFSYNNSIVVIKDTSYIITGISLQDTIVVTAFDNLADLVNDQVEGHESWFSEEAIINNATEIKSVDVKSPESIALWPNPVEDILNIQIANHSKGNVGISILSLDGKVLYCKINSDLLYEIDLSFLKSGIYLIKVNMDNKVISKKIIKR
jgi:hypothetical protein